MRRWLVAMFAMSVPMSAEVSAEPPAVDVPTLVSRLNDSDLVVRRDATRMLGDWGSAAATATEALVERIADPDTQISNGALDSLAMIGPAAEAAIPKLMERLDDGDDQMRYRAAFAIGRIAIHRPEVLRPALAHSSARARAGAALAVGWLGTNATPLLPELAQLVRDDDPTVHENACESLIQLGAASSSELVKLLHDAAWPVRERAIRCLGQVPRDAAIVDRAVLDLLIGYANHPEGQNFSVVALPTLAKWAPHDTQAMDLITRQLRDSSEVRQRAAMTALIELTEVPPSLVTELVAQLDKSAENAALAAFLLSELSPRSRQALPALLDRLQREPEQSNAEMERIIRRMGPEVTDELITFSAQRQIAPQTVARILGPLGSSIRATILQLLDVEDGYTRSVGCLSLAAMRPDAQWVERLVPMVADLNPQVRAAAAEALGHQREFGRVAIDVLRNASNDPEPTVRWAALQSLLALDNDADQRATLLLQGLRDRAVDVRLHAVAAISTVEHQTAPMTQAIREMLHDATPAVRQAAIRALAHEPHETEVEQVRDELVHCLQDTDSTVQQLALATLGKLGKLNETAVLAMVAQSRGSDLQQQRAAIEALGQAGRTESTVALTRIRELLHDGSIDLRREALRALSQMTPDRPADVQLLVQGLQDDDWSVRRQAAQALGNWKADALPAVPQLLEMLRRDVETEAVADALRQIDNAPPECLPTLIAIVQETTDRRRRFYALYLLRKLGPKAKDAIPALRAEVEKTPGRGRDMLERTIKELEAAAS